MSNTFCDDCIYDEDNQLQEYCLDHFSIWAVQTVAAGNRVIAAARNLRAAQKAYMAKRGDDELGKLVAQAAEQLDIALEGVEE